MRRIRRGERRASRQSRSGGVPVDRSRRTLAWYQGARHDLIAYDAVVNPFNRNTEVFTIRPDGSGKTCISCDSTIPKGFVGQPAWHPDGEHLVIQAENRKEERGQI